MDIRHVIELLKRADLHDEAAAVGMVMQQRAELLEALKVVADHYALPDKVWVTARKAITKAEAAE